MNTPALIGMAATIGGPAAGFIFALRPHIAPITAMRRAGAGLVVGAAGLLTIAIAAKPFLPQPQTAQMQQAKPRLFETRKL